MKKTKIKLSTRNKFILSGLITTTALVIGSGIWAVSEVQDKMDNLYQNYAQTISKTLAVNSSINDETKIKEQLSGIINTAKDILYIEYRDENNRLIFSTKDEDKSNDNEAKIVVSSPVYLQNSSDEQVIGSVSIAMNGNGIKNISQTTKNTLFMVFLLTWLTFMAVLVVNAILVGRELELLQDGVKQISTGQFGVKLETPDSGSGIQKLTEVS